MTGNFQQIFHKYNAKYDYHFQKCFDFDLNLTVPTVKLKKSKNHVRCYAFFAHKIKVLERALKIR